jgi:short-chain fatty acids transporter
MAPPMISFLSRLSERWVPGAFVIACLLTFFTMGAAVTFTDAGPVAVVGYWGDGVWVLLKFGMQMCLIIMTGSIIADSRPVRRGLDALARLPKTGRGAVVMTAAASMVLCWLHWGLGLIASAFLARSVARRKRTVDYRLLVAAAYLGMGAVWHAGLSGSSTLLVATPGNFLADRIGGTLPTSATIFSGFNLALTLATFVVLCALFWALYPSKSEDRFELDADAFNRLKEPPEQAVKKGVSPWLRFIEHGYFLCGAIGCLGLLYLFLSSRANGFQLTLDNLNFLFLCAAVLAHRSPAEFTRAAEKAAGYVHGIVVQFPLYAGMFGIIKGSGLDRVLAEAFVAVASAETFPLAVYWYSGLLNYLIPSGGSQFVVEAPYILEAADRLGVSHARTVVAFAWGDMVTNSIQPFWCLPLLAVAELEFKDVLGALIPAFLTCLLLGSVAFLI